MLLKACLAQVAGICEASLELSILLIPEQDYQAQIDKLKLQVHEMKFHPGDPSRESANISPGQSIIQGLNTQAANIFKRFHDALEIQTKRTPSGGF
jgi:hypothetical protein